MDVVSPLNILPPSEHGRSRDPLIGLLFVSPSPSLLFVSLQLLSQSEVVKAQLAVQRHRAGLVDDDGDNASGDVTPAAGVETPPSPRTTTASAPSQQQARTTAAAAAAEGDASPGQESTGASSTHPPLPRPRPPPLSLQEGGTAGPEGFGAGEDRGAGGHGQHGEDGAAEDSAVRKTEEAEALASQLQIIAMHLVSFRAVVVFRDSP